MDSIALHNRLTPGWLLIVAVKLGFGVAMGTVGLIGLGRGNTTSAAWTALAAGLGLLGFGLYDLRLLLDRTVQITLTPEGLLDHRMTTPVLLPWAQVVSIVHDSANGHSLHVTVSGVEAARFTGPGTAKSLFSSNTVDVQLDHVDVSFDALEQMVHRLAPDVVSSSLTRRPHDGRGRV